MEELLCSAIHDTFAFCNITAPDFVSIKIEDVLWVNRVMSEVDVQALMMSHVTGHEAGAVLAFAMTQPDDHLTNLMDYSTSNYVGEFMGDPKPELMFPAQDSRPPNW